MSNQITEITRRAIIDEIMESELHWSGRKLDEVEFLNRIYPLDSFPTTDSRIESADGDIRQHRYNNYDWDDDWVFEDERFCLIEGDDEIFLRFLAETVHPVVRPKFEDVLNLVDIYNGHLQYDGYELYQVERISGRPIYGPKEIAPIYHMAHEYSPEEMSYDQIWDNGIFRVFISHTATWKADAEKLKRALQLYGIASFVAHIDVNPTVEWLQEIEKALRSMDLMVPIITEDFRNSVWTDQEVGAAVGRNVPVFPVKIEKDPHGFMGKI